MKYLKAMKNTMISFFPPLQRGEKRIPGASQDFLRYFEKISKKWTAPVRRAGWGVLFRKSLSFLLIFSFVTSWSYGLVPGLQKFSPDVKVAKADSAWAIRQEINIIDGYMSAADSAYATSSGIVNLDKTRYSGTVTYYFEVVASTTSAISGDIYLRSTSGTTYATASYDTSATSPTLWRSSSFTPPSSATDLVAVIDNESGATKSIKAARIVVLQSFAGDANSAATSTQTQIEIGNEELGKTNTTNSALNFPKYWTYSSSTWDGTKTLYAEVTYKTGAQLASSTTYTSTSTGFKYVSTDGVSYVTVEAWGAGGGGGVGGNFGGGGGGGGAYAKSIIATTSGSTNSISVGVGQLTDTTTEGDSTFNITQVVADGGEGSGGADSGTEGTAANSTGNTLTYSGGAGPAGNGTGDLGGGGGGAAGPDGAGVIGSATGVPTAGAGGSGGAGDNGSGGAGGLGGNAVNGSPGTDNATGGGGGGGGDDGTYGGVGGIPGGGGGGSDAAGDNRGGAGQIKITETYGKIGIALEEDDGNFGSWTFKKMISTNGGVVSTSTSSRIRSASFTPTDGRHYRIVASSTHSGFSYDIYNAKIIFDQGLSWYNNDWSYRKAISIDNTKVSGTGDLTNFPVLVNLTDSNLASNAQTDGDDILFTTSDGKTRAYHEIEKYTTATGEIAAWVKVPTLAGSTDTTLYMYYGNAATSSEQTPTLVWDSSYKGVWHLGETVTDEATSGTHYDSTSNDNDLTQNNNGPGTGKIGSAQNFDGTSDYIVDSTFSNFSSVGDFTVSGWVKHDGSNLGYIFGGANVTNGKEISLQVSNADGSTIVHTNNVAQFTTTSDLPSNVWAYFSIIRSGTTINYYFNGSVDAQSSTDSGNISITCLMIGAYAGTACGANAPITNMPIDEFRISTSARSADWIKTEYNNQNSTSTFYTVGGQVNKPTDTFTKLEAQYLLANTKLASGAGLQSNLTKWDSTEWSGVTNVYLHAVDTDSNSSGTVTIEQADGGGTLSNSTVSSPANHATSTPATGFTMPASENLDMKDVGNSGDIYGSRILVQVTQSSGVAISGVAYQSEGGAVWTSKTVKAYKNGSTSLGQTTTNASTGAWSLTGLTLVSGDIVTVYVDGETSDANTIFISDSTAQTNVDLYGGALVIRSDATAGTTTNANIQTGYVDDAADMIATTSGTTNLSLTSNNNLHVYTGDTYLPGGTVTTQGTGDLRVATSSIAFLDTDSNTIAGDIIAYDSSLVYINKNTAVNGGDIKTQGTNNTGNFLYSGGSFTPTVTLSGTGSIADYNATSTFYALTISSTGVVNASSTFAMDNALTVNSSGNLSPGNGAVYMKNGSSVVNSGTLVFNKLDIAASATVTSGSSFSVASDLTVNSSGNLSPSAGTVTITGGTITNSGTLAFKNLTIAGSPSTSATFSVTGDMTSSSGTLTTSGGAITVTGDLTVTGTITGTGDITVNGGDTIGNGTLNLTSGTFLLDGAGLFGGSTGWTFNKLTFGNGSGITTSYGNGTGSITSATTTIANNQTLDAGVSKTWNLTASHEPFQLQGTFLASSSSFVYQGSNNATVTPTTYYNLEISPSSGSPTIKLATTTSQTITVNNNFTINGSGAATVDVNTRDPALDINGNFSLGSGDTFQASDSAVFSLAGNFTNNSGAFTANASTLTLDTTGTAIITSAADMSFYNLTVTTAGKSLQFQKHTANVPTFSFDGLFTVTGSTGNWVNIQSDTPSSQWMADFNVAQTAVTYASVRDSACAVGSMTVSYSVTNSGGGNVGSCWNIGNIGAIGNGAVHSTEQGSGGGTLRGGGTPGGSSGDSGTDGGGGGGLPQGGGAPGGGGGSVGGAFIDWEAENQISYLLGEVIIKGLILFLRLPVLSE